MFDPHWYAILPRDDGSPDTSLMGTVEVFGDLNDVVAFYDEETPHWRDSHGIYRLTEVPESALWEWAIRKPGEPDPTYAYVNERAARSSLPAGYELLKRRRGTTAWTVAEEEPA